MKENKSNQKKTVSRANANQPFFQKKSEKEPFFKPKGSENGFFSKERSFFSPPLTFNSKPIQKKEDDFSEDLQMKANSTFGEDFSNVSIHKNSSKAKDLGALAFTQGENIHFAPGEFNPQSQKGQELIGHEVAHVQQQRQNRVKPTIQTKNGNVNNSPLLEKEADEKGKQFANSENFEVIQSKRISSINRGTNAPIQMLKKTNHPWTGTVVGARLLALRETPNGTTLADLPDRTLVNVTNTSGNWLELEVDTSQAGIILNSRARRQLSGSTLEGFSYHTYIDDAAAAEMTVMLGQQATWNPSGANLSGATGGMRSSTIFDNWASAASESAAPPVNSVTTINCWEMILLAAFRIGAVDWNWINQLYTNPQPTNTSELQTWYNGLPSRITSGSLTSYDLATKTPLPERGDLVFFDGAAHVALATGNGDEILTFWPPPNTAFTAGGTVDDVKTSTIEALSDWMTTNFGTTPAVTFGSPSW
jgi:hypothetical protein